MLQRQPGIMMPLGFFPWAVHSASVKAPIHPIGPTVPEIQNPVVPSVLIRMNARAVWMKRIRMSHATWKSRQVEATRLISETREGGESLSCQQAFSITMKCQEWKVAWNPHFRPGPVDEDKALHDA